MGSTTKFNESVKKRRSFYRALQYAGALAVTLIMVFPLSMN